MAISPQALVRVRRRKAARRLFRDMPLFAFQAVNDRTETAYADQDEFWNDLPVKTKRKREKFKKNSLTKYGRYTEMGRQIQMRKTTRDITCMDKAQLLRKYMTKRYRIIVQKDGIQAE